MSALDVRAVVDRGGFRLDAALVGGPGETVAVMGPSGAGKSTLLDIVAGLVRLDDGHVRVGDRELSARGQEVPPQRRGTVLLRQDPHLFPHLSARDNVAFGLRAHGIDKARSLTDADEWLRRVGLPGSGDRRPHQLSGGQQQRVALARALAIEPEILLLDEPLTALDPETASGVRAMLGEQLPSAHTTTVLVTHDAVDAAALAHQLVLLEGGVVTQAASVREVLASPVTDFGAAVAGVNRVPGVVIGGTWSAGSASLPMPGAADGPAVVLFSPGAGVLEPIDGYASAIEPVGGHPKATEPGGGHSQGVGPAVGAWVTRVERMEQTPGGVRVYIADPTVAVDVSVGAVAEHRLAAGLPVRLRVDPSAVRIVR